MLSPLSPEKQKKDFQVSTKTIYADLEENRWGSLRVTNSYLPLVRTMNF